MLQTLPLFTAERRQQIATLVAAAGRVTVAELRARFGVSEVTLRKDLIALEGEGKLQRTHGGAIILPHEVTEQDFVRREALQAAEKARIATMATTLVVDGTTIALDASTSALALARQVRGRRDLTVVTSGLRITLELAGAPGITVLMPGGQVRPEALSLVGGWGAGVLGQVHIQRAFVGAQGLTQAAGLTDVNAAEVAMKRDLVGAASEVVALVDHTKWGQAALATFCPFEALSTIVTDASVAPDLAHAAQQAGIALLAAP
ncbi:MAG: DeoR/GlpR transcriptional regulator [Ktedonobacterales bacterium]|nr:DeoR/GlpR transcriptional regulator [Ktedonobacterales bacterium]